MLFPKVTFQHSSVVFKEILYLEKNYVALINYICTNLIVQVIQEGMTFLPGYHGILQGM